MRGSSGPAASPGKRCKLTPMEEKVRWVPPREWDPTLRRNASCEVCYQSIAFCPGIDAQCMLCPVVVHITCLDIDERKKAFDDNFLCAFCVDDFEYSRDKFLEQRFNQTQTIIHSRAQVVISSCWRCYRGRKIYKIVMGLILKLQNAVRARYRVKLLTQYRVGLLRPMHISVLRCNNLAVGDSSGSADPYVIMTVIDTNNTESQCWSFQTVCREESLNPVYLERFMVPGISGKQTLVLTVVDKDDVRHQSLGQASIRMSNPGDAWKNGGSFVLPISRVKYIPKVAGSPLRLDYTSIVPQGSIEVKIEPVSNVSANCGYMMGPSINDLERNFKHITASSGITYVDENGAVGKGSVSRPQVIGKYQMKRIWVVIVDSRVYLHKRFGETCRFVLDLKKCQLESSMANSCLRFTLKIDSYPGFEFDCIDTTDALCWKLSFYTAWKSCREEEYNFRSLMETLRKEKKDREAAAAEAAVDDDISLGSLASQRSMRSFGSQGSFGGLSRASSQSSLSMSKKAGKIKKRR